MRKESRHFANIFRGRVFHGLTSNSKQWAGSNHQGLGGQCPVICRPICRERAALAAASDPYKYVEKRKLTPDRQETGVIYGSKNKENKSEE
ncbi:uncharacterized protein LOC111409360 isoform X1 [Olea europaea subsp. europaea]|uniref:Uncharacterized protein LOC111409360 isoform X1 n=1 Tax=Olea europaea subsp. europaea TaxID=158383 RepID=A0A8S0STC0_OLEEU|nr:uncharacterized protein LOC111409360 isoform X1 [Olea europaea subsp. europaea]